MIRQNKIVILGAGKIGRSFIGQLFSQGGYEVVFIDVNKRLIDELNRRKEYRVVIKSDEDKVGEITVTNIRGVWADDGPVVSREIATAGIVAVSVGQQALLQVLPTLGESLLARYDLDKRAALDIIIAENMRNSDTFFREGLKEVLPSWYPLDRLVGLIETSIGKMVPIMMKMDSEEDALQVFAEPFNTLILDRKGFKNPIPAVTGLSPKDNIKAWVDRKIFIHNLGHAAAAYLGYLHNPGFVFIHEALALPQVNNGVRNTMLQSAEILIKKYPGEFSLEELTEHIDDLLLRFRNRALGDTIFRVGRDLIRKLGPEDRFAVPIKTAIELKLPYDKILNALVYGFHFRATDEGGKMLPQDMEFASQFKNGIIHVMTEICGFDTVRYGHVHGEAMAIEGFLGSDYMGHKTRMI